MARLPRVVAPGLPHHVTQRGNRRQQTFFSDDDYAEYRRLLAESCRSCGTDVLAYCLMPNHVHLILVPADEFGLRDALGEAHRRYTRMVNFRAGWQGHLWQERFHSFVMDERQFLEDKGPGSSSSTSAETELSKLSPEFRREPERPARTVQKRPLSSAAGQTCPHPQGRGEE